MWSQEELKECVVEAKSSAQFTREALASTILGLFNHSKEALRIGKAGIALIHAQGGAMQCTLEAITPFLDQDSKKKATD